MSNLFVTSGDAYLNVRRLTVSVTDEDGVPIDLSATDLTFMVKRHRYDDDADALIDKTTSDGIEVATPQTGDTKGKAYIELDEVDTDALDGRYYWELEAIDAVGRVTLGSGKFYVNADLVVGA